jgi:hypothetical protein
MNDYEPVLSFMQTITDQSNLNVLGLKIIACFACIVYFSINMAKVSVTRHTCMMHIIKPIAGSEPKAFQLLILTFDTSAPAYSHTNFLSVDII